ncbi:MAG: serine/threonine protein kinase [Deltaproteobacteria bacterium]|nr:serine/threonine protein kinase [Kofleriaceae bacterium]
MSAVKTVLGDAEVLHAIKSGGMGDVLLARRRGAGDFEQLCAIKTIRGELAAAPLARTMFLDEARLLARLTHPAIAQILGFGDQDGTLYMMMEYVPGEHFRRFRDRRPPPAIVCAAMASACRGLHAAHELRDLGDGHLLGVVHRDVSPDNLMLGFDARVKVLDFGIALVKGRQAPVTELGVLKGKPPYMSPEQVKNEALDRRSDVFSACVVLHELLAGKPLFEGDSLYAIARAVEHQELVPPSRWAGALPADLDDVVMAGLTRDRERGWAARPRSPRCSSASPRRTRARASRRGSSASSRRSGKRIARGSRRSWRRRAR